MAEALVSGVLEQLGSIPARIIWVDVAKEVEKLDVHLRTIQAVLKDAESRRRSEPAVRDWLSRLKDASYDIDDLLSTWRWNAAIQKRKMEEVNEISSKFSEKVSSFVYSHFFCFRQALPYRDIARKVKYLNKTLANIVMEKKNLNFEIIEHRSEDKLRMTTPFINLSKVHGRDHDKNEVVKLLLSVGSAGQTLPVISIVGMGGIGKTTVVQMAYNDHQVLRHFELRIWVCVSNPFDVRRVAQAIVECLGVDMPIIYGLENVLVGIRKSVEGKKILLVLDDVWTEDYKKWEPINLSLESASLGSKILVTTRKENVAISMRTTNIIQLGKLSHKESWSLFSRFVFYGNKSEEECKKLENIVEIIVKKCDGVPLVIEALGNLLHSQPTVGHWERILDSDLWELKEVIDAVFTSLLLSYDDLPSMLKKCFLYCAIFPKDYKIIKDKLIKLWMAQGYLDETGDEVLIGEKCFKNLEMRFFFQEFERSEYDGSIISCKMHNIMHDLARFLVKNEFCTGEIDGLAKPELELYYKEARHLMIIGNSSSIDVNNEKLRSLIVERTASDFKIGVDLSKSYDKLKCIRTLDLSSCSLEEIQEGIKKLISLRYLNLSHNVKLEKLPETLCELYYLQTLDVTNCFRLQKLPHGMGKLSNLRHLRNHGISLSYMPKGIQRLTCLRELSKFVVSNVSDDNKACSLVGLENLKDLRGFLLITGLGNVSEVGEVKKAKLEDKTKLYGLGLRFDGWMYAEDEGIFKELQPPPNLQELMIQYYTGRTMPLKWILSLTKLRVLKLSSCFEFEYLPALGKLSTLESLKIWNMTSVKKVGNEFLIENGNKSSSSSSSSSSVFPNLKYLAMSSMEEWEEWEESDFDVTSIMPCLHFLKLSSCPKLKSLPKYIIRPTPRLEKLEIKNCDMLEQLYNEKTGPDFSEVYHIPRLSIMGEDKIASRIQDKGKGKMPIDFSTTMGSDPRTSNSA